MDSQKLTLLNRIKDSDIYFSFIKSPTAILSTLILIIIFFCSFFVEYEEVYVDFKADWARIIENHLDILHVFWMHGDTIPDKNVNRDTITSFNQKIKRDNRQIESIYSYKTNGQEEFIRIKFVPPGRIFIYKGSPESTRYIQVLDHIPLGNNKARVIVRHYRKFLKNTKEN